MQKPATVAAPARAAQFQAGAVHYCAWSLAALTFWLLVGELGIAMRERCALPTGLVMLRGYAASDTTISFMLSTLPALVSLFVVPYIGYRSDRSRSRWGRRRPFLLVAAPLGALAMAGVAFAPAIAGFAHAALGRWSPGLHALHLGCFCLFWTIFDCAAISALALFSGLVNDVMPRAFLGRFYALFRIVGLGVAISFNTWVFALTDAYLFEILLAIALVFGLAIPLMCLAIREGHHPAHAAAPSGAGASRFMVARGHLAQCFTQRNCLWAFASFMLAAVTFSPFNTFSQHYALALGLSKADLGALTATAYAVSIISAFGIGWLVDRFGPVRVSAIMMGLYFMIALSGWMLVGDAATFRYFYLAHVIMSGAYFTAAASMPMALFPRSEFVRYNSSKEIMVAFASIIVGTIQGPALDMSGHDYRLTMASAAVFSLLCMACLAKLLAHATPLPTRRAD